ncbi:MAG TPA: carboxypeptidase-like regulatory domain-containing protein, partial [Terriglobales bacterium]|nr:carboxypeptidase-like regulatory domain-containing protein [Terriglobales bacterium]
MKNFLRLLSLPLLASILPVCAWAQFSGNIQGDVHDPSGASITTATVTLISAATNIQRTTTSDANG